MGLKGQGEDRMVGLKGQESGNSREGASKQTPHYSLVLRDLPISVYDTISIPHDGKTTNRRVKGRWVPLPTPPTTTTLHSTMPKKILIPPVIFSCKTPVDP